MGTALKVASKIDRPLGSTERIYWLLDKLYCLNFVVFAEIEGRLDPARLASALAVVQDENPLLRARIVQAGGDNRFEPVARTAAPLQIELRPLRNWHLAIEAELQRRFDTARAPLARALWFKGAGRKSVLAMCFQHAIGDGRSGLAVLFDLLRRATVDASPPRYKAAHASSQALDLIRRKPLVLGALQGMKFWLDKGRETLLFPQQLPGFDPAARPERRIRVLPFVVAAPQLTRLLANARLHGTTLQGALGAALLLALNQQFPKPGPRRLGLNSLADLRPVLGAELSEADLGLYVSTLHTVHALGLRPDFWALAREIRGALKQIIESGDANLINGVFAPASGLLPGHSVARLVQSVVALAPPSSMLTNLGKVAPPELGDAVALKTLGAVVSPPAQHPVCVAAVSCGGRLFLNLLFDELKLGSGQAQEIGDALMAHLQAGAVKHRAVQARDSA